MGVHVGRYAKGTGCLVDVRCQDAGFWEFPYLMINTPRTSASGPDITSCTFDDGLTLIELWRAACQGKWLVLACTLLGLALASFVIWKTPSSYQAKVWIKPAPAEVFQSIPVLAEQHVTPELALDFVRQELSSLETYALFAAAHPELFVPVASNAAGKDDESAWADRVQIAVGASRARNEPTSSVYMRVGYPRELDGARIANAFVNFAIASAKAKGAEMLRQAQDAELIKLNEDIRKQRLARIVALELEVRYLDEQLQIARALDWQEPRPQTIATNRAETDVETGWPSDGSLTYRDGAIIVDIVLGKRQHELKAAQKWLRESNGGFNGPSTSILVIDYGSFELLNKVRAAQQLSDMRVDLSNVEAVDVSQEATAATAALARPRYALLLGLGGALGLFGGLLIVLMLALGRANPRARARSR